jgi:hypothetical protein
VRRLQTGIFFFENCYKQVRRELGTRERGGLQDRCTGVTCQDPTRGLRRGSVRPVPREFFSIKSIPLPAPPLLPFPIPAAPSSPDPGQLQPGRHLSRLPSPRHSLTLLSPTHCHELPVLSTTSNPILRLYRGQASTFGSMTAAVSRARLGVTRHGDRIHRAEKIRPANK